MLFLFQMVFMDTTATIPTGAMAERWKFKSFIVFGFFISMFVYPIFRNWVWGAGWLSQLGAMFHLGHGHVDFAGSSVVHMVGGGAALAGATVWDQGSVNMASTERSIQYLRVIPDGVAWLLHLAFGWFGFIPGLHLLVLILEFLSLLSVTMLASASGAVIAALYMKAKTEKWDPRDDG